MLCHQKRKIRIRRLFLFILIAVPVHRDNPVGVLVHHNPVRVHAKRPHPVLKLFRAVNNLTLIKLIRQMRKNHRRQLHAHADIHAVGLCGYVKTFTNFLHPLAPASAHGNDTSVTFVRRIVAANPVPVLRYFHIRHRRIKVKINLILHPGIKIFQHNIIDVRSQMTHRRIKQIEFILQTQLL